jgi:hypothetical protein
MLGTFDYQYGQAAFTPRDPLSSVQPPRNPLQPGQMPSAQPQLGTTPGNSQGFLQNFLTGASQFFGGAKQKAEETIAGAKEKYPNAGRYARGGLALAGSLPAVGESLTELQAGRPLGAVAALAPAGLSAAGAALMGKGPYGTAAGLALMGLGAILPGAAASGAESVRQKATGEPTKGKEGEFSTQMAINKQLAELGTTQYRDNMGVYTSSLKDLSKAYSDQEYLNLQRNIPLINQMKNADLVRQQALMNTQNQGYMQQGVLATAGSLALQSNQNVAQLTNTALQTNPYASATLQAPQIRFG